MTVPLPRRFSIIATTLGMLGAVVLVGPTAPVHAANQTITLLNVNDFHGRIDTANDLTTKWATTIEQQRLIDPNALLLGAGDLMGASLFNSAVQADQPTIDVFNELCMNASSVGNHEFDKGFTDLTGRVINGAAGVAPDACPTMGSGSVAAGTNARWAYVGANVYLKGTQTPALPEYTIFTVNGVTVGVIGAVTGETPALVSPGGITQIDIGDPVAAVNRVAAQLSDGNGANGEAQVIVAEYHEGAANGALTLDQNLAAPAPNPFAEIVNGTSPQVDVIFTGHTHQLYVYDAPVTGGSLPTRPVVQTGNYADHVGKVVLTVDDQTGAVVAAVASNLAPAAAANLALPRVAKVAQIVQAAKAFADTVGLQQIGTQSADITTAFTGGTYSGPGGAYVGSGGPNSKAGRDDRSKESTMGDLVANALRATLAPANLGGAQIGVTNPGGLRDELFYLQTGMEGTGVVTFAEANNVLPFVNNLWTTTLTGAQFKTMLEQQWQRDAGGNVPTRAYLQLGLSDNVTYTFDDSLPSRYHAWPRWPRSSRPQRRSRTPSASNRSARSRQTSPPPSPAARTPAPVAHTWAAEVRTRRQDATIGRRNRRWVIWLPMPSAPRSHRPTSVVHRSVSPTLAVCVTSCSTCRPEWKAPAWSRSPRRTTSFRSSTTSGPPL